MVVGFGILIPIGVLVARILKPLDPLWFHLHRAIQVYFVTPPPPPPTAPPPLPEHQTLGPRPPCPCSPLSYLHLLSCELLPWFLLHPAMFGFAELSLGLGVLIPHPTPAMTLSRDIKLL